MLKTAGRRKRGTYTDRMVLDVLRGQNHTIQIITERLQGRRKGKASVYVGTAIC